MIDKQTAIEKLTRQISEIDELKNQNQDSGQFDKWDHLTKVLLKEIFGEDKEHYQKFSNISYCSSVVMPGHDDADFHRWYCDGLNLAKSYLEAYKEEVQEYWQNEEHTEIPESNGDSVNDNQERVKKNISWWVGTAVAILTIITMVVAFFPNKKEEKTKDSSTLSASGNGNKQGIAFRDGTSYVDDQINIVTGKEETKRGDKIGLIRSATGNLALMESPASKNPINYLENDTTISLISKMKDDRGIEWHYIEVKSGTHKGKKGFITKNFEEIGI